jgi:hypothetical protein
MYQQHGVWQTRPPVWWINLIDRGLLCREWKSKGQKNRQGYAMQGNHGLVPWKSGCIKFKLREDVEAAADIKFSDNCSLN